MSSWKEKSRRVHGGDDYHWGDFIRCIWFELIQGSQEDLASKLPIDSMRETQDSMEPLERAVLDLQSMRKCLERFASLNFSHCSHAFDKIRLGIEELEARIEEAAAYQKTCPESGTLLQIQVCSAAGDQYPPEWSMGQLHASTESLFFESNESPPWRIGPVRWSDITSMEKLCEHGSRPECAGDIRLAVSGEATAYLFSGVNHVDILAKLGHLIDEAPDMQSTPVTHGTETSNAGDLWTSLPEKEATSASQVHEVAGDVRPHPVGSRDAPADSWFNQFDASSESQHVDETPAPPASSLVRGKCLSRTLSRSLSFVPGADESLPHEVPSEAASVVQQRMPNVTLDQIYRLLSIDGDEWPIRSFLKERLKITDVEETKWSPSRRIPGTLIRRLRFQMPVPDDLPATMKKLLSLPESCKVISLARLGRSPDKVIFVQETCTHNITYGDKFSVQDVLTFNSEPSGGVIFEKFTNLRWVAALPWYAGVLVPLIEMKAKEQSKKVGRKLIEYLEREHAF